MKKVLICVDDTNGSLIAIEKFVDIFSAGFPEATVLVYVEKIEGRSFMDEMLGDAELVELKEALKNTEYQEALDKKAKYVLDYFEKALKGKGVPNISRVIKAGHPADEILMAAGEEHAEIIIIGSRGKRLHTILLGSVSREVANRADIPVLIAR